MPFAALISTLFGVVAACLSILFYLPSSKKTDFQKYSEN